MNTIHHLDQVQFLQTPSYVITIDTITITVALKSE
jgi:hypothetical protein